MLVTGKNMLLVIGNNMEYVDFFSDRSAERSVRNGNLL